MKVKDLIAALQEKDPDAEVHFSYNYGDHWRTQVAAKVRKVEYEMVVHSDYHSMPIVVDEDDKRYDKAEEVIVLS